MTRWALDTAPATSLRARPSLAPLWPLRRLTPPRLNSPLPPLPCPLQFDYDDEFDYYDKYELMFGGGGGRMGGGGGGGGGRKGQGGGGGGTGSMKGPYSSRHIRAMESRLSQARG